MKPVCVKADLSFDPIAKEIDSQIFAKICDAYGLRLANWSGTLKLDSVIDKDGAEHNGPFLIPVKLLFEVSEVEDRVVDENGVGNGRGGYRSKSLTIIERIKPNLVDDVHGVPHILRKNTNNFTAYCSTIVHELTHQIDYLIHTSEVYKAQMSSPPKGERNGISDLRYYASIGEFRAFLRQMLYLAEKRLVVRIEEGKFDKFSKAELETIFHGNVHAFCKLMLEQKWLTDKFVQFVTSTATHGTAAQTIELNKQFEAFQKNLARRYEHASYSGA